MPGAFSPLSVSAGKVSPGPTCPVLCSWHGRPESGSCWSQRSCLLSVVACVSSVRFWGVPFLLLTLGSQAVYEHRDAGTLPAPRWVWEEEEGVMLGFGACCCALEVVLWVGWRCPVFCLSPAHPRTSVWLEVQERGCGPRHLCVWTGVTAALRPSASCHQLLDVGRVWKGLAPDPASFHSLFSSVPP